MHKNIVNKKANNINQKSNKSLKRHQSGKSDDKKIKIQNKNKLRQFNKNDEINNNINIPYNNSNLRVKSSKKFQGIRDKNKLKKKINNINSNTVVKNFSSLNLQKNIQINLILFK